MNSCQPIDKKGFYCSSDTVYFNSWTKLFILSAKKYAPWAHIHVHIFDPVDADYNWCNKNNISISSEITPTQYTETIDTKKGYWVNMRFVRLAELYSNSTSVIAIDSDSLFVQKLNGLQRLVDARTGEEIYDNVKKKGDTIEFYTVDEAKSIESAKLKAIEMFLTDKAMKNIYNEYSFTKDRLFSYPKQLMAIINTYPSLLNDYILPGLFEPVVRKNSSVMGLKLKTSEKDAIFKSQLHEELNKLSDEGEIKHENPEVNKYISNIFSMLSTYSLFTEGYSKSAGLAISDIIDQTKLSEKMTIQNTSDTPNKKKVNVNHGHLENHLNPFAAPISNFAISSCRIFIRPFGRITNTVSAM
jgi:hypothetical protein